LCRSSPQRGCILISYVLVNLPRSGTGKCVDIRELVVTIFIENCRVRDQVLSDAFEFFSCPGTAELHVSSNPEKKPRILPAKTPVERTFDECAILCPPMATTALLHGALSAESARRSGFAEVAAPSPVRRCSMNDWKRNRPRAIDDLRGTHICSAPTRRCGAFPVMERACERVQFLESRPYRSVPDPWQRCRDPCRGDDSTPRLDRFAYPRHTKLVDCLVHKHG